MRYGRRRALADCTLEIPPGHVVGLVGPNGAGKTTLLKIACGQLMPTSGRIEVLGDRRPSAPGSWPASAMSPRTPRSTGTSPSPTT
jgi:ABC-2 type transport system ATP-binding protein